jgi:hypothetical protein
MKSGELLVADERNLSDYWIQTINIGKYNAIVLKNLIQLARHYAAVAAKCSSMFLMLYAIRLEN